MTAFQFDPFSRDERFALVDMDEGKAVVELDRREAVFVDPKNEIRSWSTTGDYLLGVDEGSSFHLPYTATSGFEITGAKEVIYPVGTSDGAFVLVATDTEYIVLRNDQVRDYTVVWVWENIDDHFRRQ